MQTSIRSARLRQGVTRFGLRRGFPFGSAARRTRKDLFERSRLGPVQRKDICRSPGDDKVERDDEMGPRCALECARLSLRARATLCIALYVRTVATRVRKCYNTSSMFIDSSREAAGMKRVLNHRRTMACVSENSRDDGRYLNSDHPGWSPSCYPLHQRFSYCGIRHRIRRFHLSERDLEGRKVSFVARVLSVIVAAYSNDRNFARL